MSKIIGTHNGIESDSVNGPINITTGLELDGVTVTVGAGVFSQQSAVANLTDNSGGAAADGTIGAVTAPSALTDNSGGSASTTLAAITGGGAGCENATKNAVASLAARQAEDRTAIVALTDAVKELSTKINAINAILLAAGVTV